MDDMNLWIIVCELVFFIYIPIFCDVGCEILLMSVIFACEGFVIPQKNENKKKICRVPNFAPRQSDHYQILDAHFVVCQTLAHDK